MSKGIVLKATFCDWLKLCQGHKSRFLTPFAANLISLGYIEYLKKIPTEKNRKILNNIHE